MIIEDREPSPVFQKVLSIIPYWSTIFISVVTMYELKHNKASKKIWFYYIGVLFLANFILFLKNEVVLTTIHPLINVIISGLILAVANIVLVDLQIKSNKTS